MKSILNSDPRAHMGKRSYEKIFFQISNSSLATHSNKIQQQEILQPMFILNGMSASPAMKRKALAHKVLLLMLLTLLLYPLMRDSRPDLHTLPSEIGNRSLAGSFIAV